MADRFNKEQEIAIQHMNGPMLVLAGAGSGKTTILTYRIQHMIENGISPENIMVLTFTKAAAEEMQNRFHRLIGRKANVKFGTFHSIFLEILIEQRIYTYQNIIRSQDQQEIIREIAQANGYYLGSSYGETIERIINILNNIDLLKNHMVSKQEDLKLIRFHDMSEDELWRFYESYQKELNRRHLLDFGDMLLETLYLFLNRPDILFYYRERYPYILVDEYQDTNLLQDRLITLLAAPTYHIFCVGDDDQSIYGFRGAKPEIMLSFTEKYPKAQIIQLPYNYRSTTAIVNTADRIIRHNKNRYEKQIQAARTENTTINSVEFKTFRHKKGEDAFVVKKLREGIEKGLPAHEMACLFRTNRGVEQFAACLVKEEIPFYTEVPIRNIFDHFIAKDILAYIKSADGDRREDYRILNKPYRFIPKQMIQPGVSLDTLSMNFSSGQPLTKQLNQLKNQLKTLRKEKKTPKEKLFYIYKTINYHKYLESYTKFKNLSEDQEDELYEIFDQILNFFSKYDTVPELMEGIALYRKSLQDSRKKDKRKGRVILSTIHGSKGLEYEKVFLFDVSKKNLPFEKKGEPTDVEEERRLFYVAVTRAKNQIFILSKKEEVSMFLQEAKFPLEKLTPGVHVVHKKFGEGVVKDKSGSNLTIAFVDQARTFKISVLMSGGMLTVV